MSANTQDARLIMPMNLIAKLFVFCTVLAINGFLFGQQRIYYVSPEGDDAGNGSKQTPWATIANAFYNTRPGDMILLRAGTHSKIGDYDIDVDLGGAPGKYKTLAAYPGERAVISRKRGLRVLAPYVRIRGIEFLNGYVGVSAPSNVQVLENTFVGDCGYGCINVHGDDHLIEGNIIDNMTPTGTKNHGMYIHGGSNIVIRNNYINFNSQGYCIHVFEDQVSHPHKNIVIEGNRIGGSMRRSGIVLSNPAASIDGVLIRNNLIINNWQNGIRTKDNLNNVQIYNNTFFNNGRSSGSLDAQGDISVREYSKGLFLIKNNIFCNEDGHVQNRKNSPNIILENNLYWPSKSKTYNVSDSKALVWEPGFIDPDNGNFKLKADSRSIDAGIDLGFPYAARAPDLGAFESKEK